MPARKSLVSRDPDLGNWNYNNITSLYRQINLEVVYFDTELVPLDSRYLPPIYPNLIIWPIMFKAWDPHPRFYDLVQIDRRLSYPRLRTSISQYHSPRIYDEGMAKTLAAAFNLSNGAGRNNKGTILDGPGTI